MDTVSPKVFISHASEDKERFVIAFAKKLRDTGIDAWLDQWEIQPGDSLVRKIFDGGLKQADTVIVVISSKSVEKPWVKEEIDAAFVKKVQQSCRLIPVVIDECEVPFALQHILWVRIQKLDSYHAELKRVVNAILGVSDKPALGRIPIRESHSIISAPDLKVTDSVVLSTLCEDCIATARSSIRPFTAINKLKEGEFTIEEIDESLDVLHELHYIHLKRANLGQAYLVTVPIHILDDYLKSTRPDYDKEILDVVAKLVNENIHVNLALGEATSLPLGVINTVLEMLQNKDYLHFVRTDAGKLYIKRISPRLPRLLAE